MAALVWLAPTPAVASVRRPAPLATQANCDSYRGRATAANDATQLFELRICPSATGVSGRLQSSSLVSGSSVRESEGSWDRTGQTLTLVETRFIESLPEPDWRFCLIDELVLTKTATGLEGTYVSVACDDRATLEFEVVTQSPKGESLPNPDLDPNEPPTRADPPASACACQSDEAPAPISTLLMFGLAGLFVANARRRTR